MIICLLSCFSETLQKIIARCLQTDFRKLGRKRRGVYFRKSTRMFDFTGREPTKLLVSSVLQTAAVPRSVSTVVGPSTYTLMFQTLPKLAKLQVSVQKPCERGRCVY